MLDHLIRLNGARVTLRLEVEIDVPGGINDDVRRIIEENYRAMRFRSFGFEPK